MRKVSVFDERGDCHYYDADVHQALVSVGLIWQADDRWRCDSTRLDMGQFPELALCDFCNARPVTWDVDAATFEVMPGFLSDGGWLACEPCGAAIRNGDRVTLEARSLAFVRSTRKPGQPIAPYLLTQRMFLAKFWQHYRGIAPYPTPYAARREGR